MICSGHVPETNCLFVVQQAVHSSGNGAQHGLEYIPIYPYITYAYYTIMTAMATMVQFMIPTASDSSVVASFFLCCCFCAGV